ncbi:MAG TPA: M24 family metallopeptidase [Polyangia bacterium]
MRTGALLAILLWAAAAAAHPPVGIAPRTPTTTPKPDAASAPVTSWLDDARARLAADKLDGWLLADWRGENPVAAEVVKPRGPLHRWFYLVGAAGEPQLLCHADDAGAFDAKRPLVYRSWRELEAQLKVLLRGRRRVAMEHAPRLPALSRVDGGTIELVRGTGVQIVSSGDLVTTLRARWSDAQLASHRAAAAALAAVKDDAFTAIAHGLGRITEYDVRERAQKALADRGLEAAEPPVVAAGVHTADPGFAPSPERSERIAAGDLVLFSVAARQKNVRDAVYADLTWVGFVGERVPDEIEHLFAIARDARAAVVALVEERGKKKLPLRGFELDDAARAVAARAGLADRVLRPTGHSLDTRRFGDGPSFDDAITHDDRQLLPRTGYVVEPGLYVAGRFGVRVSVDLFLAADGVQKTPDPPQRVIDLIR